MYFLTESRMIVAALRRAHRDDPDLLKREREYATSLVKQGKIISAYRMVGDGGSFMIWDVASTDELHQLLKGFPHYQVGGLEWKVVPVVSHPTFDRVIPIEKLKAFLESERRKKDLKF